MTITGSKSLQQLLTKSTAAHNAFQSLSSTNSCASVTTMAAETLKVAVIGGGAAGLATSRILARNGIQPVVLEQRSGVGGVWRYQERSERAEKDHPVYQGLRTNIPREIMAFREKPWYRPPSESSYVTHRQVLEYLEGYKKKYELDRFITYDAKVNQLKVLEDQKSNIADGKNGLLPAVELEWTVGNDEQFFRDVFDAVCIANGHFSKPSTPNIPGVKDYYDPSQMIHSVVYDTPETFAGKRVLCIGGGASGNDLAREISQHASHVYISDPSFDERATQDNLTLLPLTLRADPSDGKLSFGTNPGNEMYTIDAVDSIVFCTGYDYHFDFINDQSNLELQTKRRRVTPLYQQLWHASYPNLAFIGIPFSVIPFPLFEHQAEAVVQQFLTHHQNLDDLDGRCRVAQLDAARGGYKETKRVEDTHYLGAGQWDYCREMAKLAGVYDDKVENYLQANQAMYDHSCDERLSTFPGAPDTYRETCYDRKDPDIQVVSSQKEMAKENMPLTA